VNAPLFSVITPAFNAGQYLAATIESVLTQSCEDFEHIIVDDHSTDDTMSIARSYAAQDNRVRVFQTEAPSGGPAKPRNVAIAAARGMFVALLDADDLWGRDKLKNDALSLAAHPELDGIYSGCDYFIDFPQNVRFRVRPRRMNSRVLITNPVPTLTFVFKRRLFSDDKFRFDEDPFLKAIEDYHLVLEMYLRGKRFEVRPGCDTFYRMLSSNSIYAARDQGRNIRRYLYSFSKVASKTELPAPRVLVAGMALLGLLAIRRVTGRL
jgi:glycosyltransferase involved in cell wall biosynthesis